MEETLDTDWINEFEEADGPYQGFYKEPVEKITVQLIYINRRNEISLVKRQEVSLENNVLKKDKLVELLKQNMRKGNIKYKPISLIKYNIDIEPRDVSQYEKNKGDFNFLVTESAIDDIVFNDTIALFSCVNCLYIILHESPTSFNNRTRKSIRLKKLKVGRQTKRA